MIKIKHPNPACNRIQAQLVEAFPEEKRHFMEMLFTHGNISFRYHQQSLSFNPTEGDWKEFLAGVDRKLRRHLEDLGFEAGKRVLPFMRFIMEKNDIGLEEYVRQEMGEQDYKQYMQLLREEKSNAGQVVTRRFNKQSS